MNKVVYKRKPWTNNDIDYLTEVYGTKPTREIGEILDRSMDSVQLKARRLGLKYDKKYTYNTSFFKSIDTEEKAYWLGFITADGYVVQNSDTRMNELGISLQGKDIAHLEKLNQAMDGNVKPSIYAKVGNFPDKRYNGKEYEMCQIRFYSKEIVEDLKSWGVQQNKSSLEIKIPNIDDPLIRHFIRGFFDGDGSLSVPKLGEIYGYRAGITCNSLSFLNDLKLIFSQYNIESGISKDRNHYKLEFSKKESLLNFLNEYYGNCHVYLDRKYDIYLQLKQLLSN